MKNIIRFFAAMAVFSMATATVNAAPKAEPKAAVYVNKIVKPHHMVVSAETKKEGYVIRAMEVSSEDGSVVYATKQVAKLTQAQYLLNIAKLEDGAYNVTFKLNHGTSVVKTFVVVNGEVVK